MPQTAAERKRRQRARDRARLGDKEYKKIEAEKMRKYRASKRPPNPPRPQPAPAQPQVQQVQQVQPVQPQAQPPAQAKSRKKAPQQLQRQPQQVVKEYIPLFKNQNATPLSDNSIATYLHQFKKIYEIFTKKKRFSSKT